jgi:hypothetical protein
MPENSEDQTDKPSGHIVDGKLEIRAGASVSSSAEVRIRLIRPSPDSDPELLEKVKEFVIELNKKKAKDEDAKVIPVIPDPPLIVISK